MLFRFVLFLFDLNIIFLAVPSSFTYTTFNTATYFLLVMTEHISSVNLKLASKIDSRSVVNLLEWYDISSIVDGHTH